MHNNSVGWRVYDSLSTLRLESLIFLRVENSRRARTAERTKRVCFGRQQSSWGNHAASVSERTSLLLCFSAHTLTGFVTKISCSSFRFSTLDCRRRFGGLMSLAATRWRQDLCEWSIWLKNNIDRLD
ncbi:hypothetical protein CEXT_227911 [Caerostris extrusa]|uniref:Uncharacterized protein n=1 Tax=Caerostris extrusa TaxID=172846 RepID=A0AAV4SHK2_CAEEX|nr:hypothetical protein CEXT_227911 [Caerostris extrusa]